MWDEITGFPDLPNSKRKFVGPWFIDMSCRGAVIVKTFYCR
jgi:hypothetical protein